MHSSDEGNYRTSTCTTGETEEHRAIFLCVLCGEALGAESTLCLPKVLPAAGFQRLGFTVHPAQEDLPPRGNPPNFGERNAREHPGHTCASRNGEQQFVIFAAMQCEIQVDRSRW